MNKTIIIAQLCMIVVMLITMILTYRFNKHNEYMDKICKRDPKETCLHINQFKSHQDIYIIPIEKCTDHHVSNSKEFYVGYYTFSLLYWGQSSPK